MPAPAIRAALECEEVDLPWGGERVRLSRRGLPGAAADRPVVLMAHGSTYSSRPTFDLPVDGASMMDALALAGIEAWALDIVGYGGSSRPASMGGEAGAGVPVSRTADAVGNVGAAVRHLLDRYRRRSLALLGWSWGTAVMGAYAASHPDDASSLVQVAPLWTREGPSATDPGGALGAYRIVAVDSVRARWTSGLSADEADRLAPVEVTAALQRELLAADADYSSANPGRIHVPNGTVADTREFWAAGRPLYDAAAIRCPVMVIAGSWDVEWPAGIADDYATALTGARVTRLVIPRATHSLILEPGRREALAAIIPFIAGSTRPPT